MSWKRLIKEYTREDSLEYLFGQVYEVLGDLEFNVMKEKITRMSSKLLKSIRGFI